MFHIAVTNHDLIVGDLSLCCFLVFFLEILHIGSDLSALPLFSANTW